MRAGVYAGTFRPFHMGHLGIVERASKIFDELIIGVGINPDKDDGLNFKDGTEQFNDVRNESSIRHSVRHLKNVKVKSFRGLVVHFAQEEGAGFLVRGLRAVSDFDYEFQMSLVNKKLNKDIETVFIMAPLSYMYLSSTLIRGLIKSGAPIDGLVPEPVKAYLTLEGCLERTIGADLKSDGCNSHGGSNPSPSSKNSYRKTFHMGLSSTNLIRYTCDQCGHTFERYADVQHPAECPKCAQHPPEDFDFPLLERIIREAVSGIVNQGIEYLSESVDGCMDDIISEIKYKLREKKKELPESWESDKIEDFQYNGILGAAAVRKEDPEVLVFRALIGNLRNLTKRQAAQVLDFCLREREKITSKKETYHG